MSTLVEPPVPAISRLPQVERPTVFTMQTLHAEERNLMAWTKAIAATSDTRHHTTQLLRELRQEQTRQQEFGISAHDVMWNMTRDYLRCVLQVPVSLSSPASSVSSQDMMDASCLGASMTSSFPSRRPPQIASKNIPVPDPEDVPREQMSYQEVNEWMRDSTRQYQEDMLSKTLSSTRQGSPLSSSTFAINRFGLVTAENTNSEESS